MVRRHGHRHHIANHWLPINWHELFACGRYRQNRRLWRVDDRNEVRGVHHAQVGDRESPTFQIGRCQLVVASLGDERFGFAGYGADSLGIGIADHRYHQPGWSIDSHANIDALVADERIPLNGTVDLGELLERKRTGFYDQIVDGDLHTLFADIGIEDLAHSQDIRHIDFAADIKVWNRLFRLGQTTGNQLLHAGELHQLGLRWWRTRLGWGRWSSLWRSRGLRRWSRSGRSLSLLKKILNIIADNAATGASPRHLAQIDAVFFCHPACQRRGLDGCTIATPTSRDALSLAAHSGWRLCRWRTRRTRLGSLDRLLLLGG